jgi:hypothetical protein
MLNPQAHERKKQPKTVKEKATTKRSERAACNINKERSRWLLQGSFCSSALSISE